MAPVSVYHPTLEAFRKLADGEANLVPVYREFAADLETPVSVYLKLMDDLGPSFLLESVEGGEQVGRYSFVGIAPTCMMSLRGRTISYGPFGREHHWELKEPQDFLHVLEREMNRFRLAELPGLPRFRGGAVGYLGYDNVRLFEKLPATAQEVVTIPEAVFMRSDLLVIFDHARHRLMVLANAAVNGDPESAYIDAIQRIERVSERLLRPIPAIPERRWHATRRPTEERGVRPELDSNMTQAQFEAIVEQAKEYIAAGDIFQVVLSQRLSRKTSAHPFAIYRALRMLNPSPYMFYFDFQGDYGVQIIGASPEMHVRLEDQTASMRAIAGTRPRGETPLEDARLAEELLNDPKERAEHVMLVDLARNDLGRVCDYGSVRVGHLMNVERYSHVMHIVSPIEGCLRQKMTPYDLMRATFPAGTVSGAPKVRAMEIIEELEGERRGLYAGLVAYIGYDGNMDSCIAIRTMVMQGDTVYVQAGAGIVADSDPKREYEECINKAGALAVAVEEAERGLF